MGENRSSERSRSTAVGEVPLDVIPLHSTNLLTVLDETGVIQYESPSIERIYGYGQDELVGEQVAEYFHPDDRERVLDAFESVVSSEEYTVEAVEYRHRTADGTYLWVESAASADPTPEGHYVVNTRDISARKEHERRLETTNERLEEFASVVSHDLRNPLNVATARLQMAQTECTSEHLDDVADAHERMGTLIDDLLTLSRVGEQVTEPEVVSLAGVSRSCWNTVVTGDATLVTDTTRRLRADRSRLRQLLENLVRNSVEHGASRSNPDPGDSFERGSASSDTGARTPVTVTVGELETGFYVEDDGPGIPPEERDRVFEAGYSGSPEGTGLGLNIVEQVADAHGWHVRVTDGTDGARFEITGVEFVD